MRSTLPRPFPLARCAAAPGPLSWPDYRTLPWALPGRPRPGPRQAALKFGPSAPAFARRRQWLTARCKRSGPDAPYPVEARKGRGGGSPVGGARSDNGTRAAAARQLLSNFDFGCLSPHCVRSPLGVSCGVDLRQSCKRLAVAANAHPAALRRFAASPCCAYSPG